MEEFQRVLDPDGRLVWVKKKPGYWKDDNSFEQWISTIHNGVPDQNVFYVRLRRLKWVMEGFPNKTLVHLSRGEFVLVVGFCFEPEQ